MTTVEIGLKNSERVEVADALRDLLADSYTLYLLTHNFHWNVTGPRFRELHLMFEEHYQDLAVAVDDIAERIRTLGVHAPGSYSEFAELTRIPEVQAVPDANDMVRILTLAHETLTQTCRKTLKVAQKVDDESTLGLVADRLQVHEKTAWMLRSSQA